jgi:VanZ family protein
VSYEVARARGSWRLAAAVGLAVLPLRYRWLWLGLGMASLLIILALALAPLSGNLPVLGGDKVAHFLAFLFLTVWFLGLCHPALTLRILLALLLYGVLIEVLQGFTPFRAVEAADVVSDMAGIGAGWLLAQAGLRGWCVRVEALLGAGPP